MVIAILAAIAAAVAIVCIALVLYMRFHDDNAKSKKTKNPVSHIEAVGVTPLKDSGGTDQRVSSSEGGEHEPYADLHPRFVALGIFSSAVFGALLVKLGGMQLFNSEAYSEAADNNRYTSVLTPAPRGIVYDCNGVALVTNRSTLTVLASSDVASDNDVIARLSAVLGIPRNIISYRALDSTAGAQSQRVIASDVKMRDIAFISEHIDAFSGVSVETRMVRSYPYGALAAHVVGYTGTASEDDLKNVPEGRIIESGDDVGKSGVEAYYDNLLAGDHGERKLVTSASGDVVNVVSESQPAQGSDIYLTIDARVQTVADQILAQQVAPDGSIGSGKGTAASAVVLDVRTGAVVAMANYPTFLPSEFVGGVSTNAWEIYTSEKSHNPLLNRAIAGTYPAASTFKAFSGLAGLKYGFADTEREWTCTGSWDGFGSGDWQNCWNHSGHGDISFHESIVQSCDVTFYEIAKCFFEERATIGDTALQDEVEKYGFGKQTGIDLDGEAYGRIPTPTWKSEYFKDVPEEASWRGGDLTNMAIGQGNILITPIQLAAAYGGIATGSVMVPHLLKEVKNTQGQTVISYEPKVALTPDVDQNHLNIVRDALHGVVTESTALAYFQAYDVDAAAKTGTAEVAGKSDFAWTVCYGPFDDPHYVAVVVVEEGGGGSAVAMPLAAQLLGTAVNAERDNLAIAPAYIDGFNGVVVENTNTTSEGRTD